MNPRFETCARRVIKAEGGFSELRGDPGGRTWFGVTERYQPAYFARILAAKTYDARIEIAMECVREEFWVPLCCDQWPDSLDYRLLDAAYMSGVLPAVIQLQRACNEFSPSLLLVDGVLGPKTKGVVKDLSSRYLENLIGWFTYWRGTYLHKIPDPSGSRWGWGRRLA